MATPNREPSAAGERAALLELHGISKRFGAVQALDGVQFSVSAGEVTLIKIISGIYRADQGTIRWQGKPVAIAAPNDSAGLGIATVYQDLALCDNLDVVANLFLGRELATPGGPLGVMDEVTMERRAVEVLRRLSVKIPSVRIPIASLSGGQRQSVAVARSVMGDNKVVLLDEPTAALGMAQTHEVLELIKRLRGQGLGVVLISHNLANVFEVADRITVLRLGRWVGTFDARATSHEQLVAYMTGAVPAAADPATSGEHPAAKGAGP
jgi:D-xylose transport system ATP-binding protein